MLKLFLRGALNLGTADITIFLTHFKITVKPDVDGHSKCCGQLIILIPCGKNTC